MLFSYLSRNYILFGIIFFINILSSCYVDTINKPWDIDWIFSANGLTRSEIEYILGGEMFNIDAEFMENITFNAYNKLSTIGHCHYLFTFYNGKLAGIEININPRNSTQQQFNNELKTHISWLLKLKSFENIICDKNIEIKNMLGNLINLKIYFDISSANKIINKPKKDYVFIKMLTDHIIVLENIYDAFLIINKFPTYGLSENVLIANVIISSKSINIFELEQINICDIIKMIKYAFPEIEDENLTIFNSRGSILN
jgi:hypothetical protein